MKHEPHLYQSSLISAILAEFYAGDSRLIDIVLAAACGAFALPEGGLDASLVVLEGPGSYTAIVGPRDGTVQSGLALVELYEAP